MFREAGPAPACGDKKSPYLSSGATWFFSMIPPPEQFYARYKDLELVSTTRLVAWGTSGLYFLVLASFAVGMWFYASPSQYLLSSRLEPRVVVPGYECKPLNKHWWYQLDWTYEQCAAKILPPGADTIVLPTDYSSSPVSVLYQPLKGYQNAGKSIWHHEDIYKDAVDQFLRPEILSRINGLAACTSDGYCMEVSENLGIYGTCDTSKSCGTVRDVAKWTTAFDLAVEIYAEYAVASLSRVVGIDSLGDEPLCDFAYHNPPFMCNKAERHELPTLIALANNISALLYTVFHFVIYKALRKRGRDDHKPKQRNWVRRFPLPPELYDEKLELTFVSTPLKIGLVSILCYLATMASFVGFLIYYSSEARYEPDITFKRNTDIESEGYTCQMVLDNREYGGLNITYAECLTKVQDVSEGTLYFKTETCAPDNLQYIGSTTFKYSSSWLPFPEMSEPTDCSLQELPPLPGTLFEAMPVPSKLGSGTSSNLGSYGVHAWQTSGTPTSWRGIQTLKVTNNAAWDSTSKAHAVEVWTEIQTSLGDAVCDWTRHSPPYQCFEDRKTLDVLTRLSLAFGLSQFVFTILSTAVVIVIADKNRRRATPFVTSDGEVREPVREERFWPSRIPIPEKFYEMNGLDLIAGSMCVFGTYVIMLVLTAAVFTLTYLFYSAQKSTETKIQASNHLLDGFTCFPLAPLRFDMYFSTWTYDECVANIGPTPDEENTGLNNLTLITSNPYGITTSFNTAIDASGSTYSTPFYATVALRPFKPSATLKPYWWSSWCNQQAECTADATVIALITAEMNTFNAVDSKIQIVADWYEGIYVRYANATTKDSTRVLQTLRNIHAALGEWELCGHTTKHPVYNCQRDLRWDTFTLVSLAYANAALFLGAFIFFVPEAIRIGKKWAPCCGDGSQVVRAVVSASGSGSFDDSARAI